MEYEPSHQADRDAVHHDRGDDFVRSGLDLEYGRHCGPQHGSRHRCHDHQRQQERRRQPAHIDGCSGGRSHSHDVLALDADVEETGLERDRDRQSRVDQRCGVLEHDREVLGPRGTERPYRAVHEYGVLAVGDDDHSADQGGEREGAGQGDHLREQEVDPLGPYARLSGSLGRDQLASLSAPLPPVMPMPSFSGGSCGEYSPVIRPS